MDKEKDMSGPESLALITSMINKAKDSYHDTGIGAMLWGSVVAICSLVKLSEIHFEYRLPFDIYLLALVAIIPQIFITIKEKKERKVKSYDDRFMDYIWLGFGISLFLLIFTLNVMFRSWGPVATEYKTLTGELSPFRLNEYISSFFLLLYGLPTFITGAACRFRPMLIGGLLCWACCIIALFTPVKVDLLLTALSAIMAWLVPGILMEKEYREYKKAQAALHV